MAAKTQTPDVRDLLVAQIETDEQSIAPIRAQIAVTEERITRARAALAALDGDVITAPRQPRASRSNGSQGPRLSPTERQEQIIAFLKANPKSTVKQMADHLSVSAPAVYNMLKGMEDRYSTEQDGRTKLYTAV